MLNIRDNIATWVVVSIVALLLGNLPQAWANVVLPTKEEITIEESTDPLERFEGAKSLTGEDLKELLSAIGFEGKALRIAWAVAMKESNARPRAYNGDLSTGDNSYGIFQINMLGSLGEDRREKFDLKTNKDLFDPVRNAQIAYHMSAKGTNWSAWKVYPGSENGSRYENFYEEFPKD